MNARMRGAIARARSYRGRIGFEKKWTAYTQGHLRILPEVKWK